MAAPADAVARAARVTRERIVPRAAEVDRQAWRGPAEIKQSVNQETHANFRRRLGTSSSPWTDARVKGRGFE
jgi:hypothetical protein